MKMKRADLFAILYAACIASVFILPDIRYYYQEAYEKLPIILSFFKFGLLATFGEMLISRFYEGTYIKAQFGLVPKALVWGILGISLYFAFTIFYGGVQWLLFRGDIPLSFTSKLWFSFLVSFFMNIFYAPILMITHHITDRFITIHNGTFPISKFRTIELLQQIDWDKMWGFVIKKTIPLFWIPVHTITFLLPEQYRILIAALLSIVLGLILAWVKPIKS